MPASRQYVPPTLPRRVPRRPGLLRIGVLVASLVLSSASVAVAASTPEANCTRGKVSSLRKALKALAVCQFADLRRPDEGRPVSSGWIGASRIPPTAVAATLPISGSAGPVAAGT
jgi:hypothetical protein